MRSLDVMVLVLCVAGAAHAEAPLEVAKRQVAALDYAAAKKTLAAAEAVEGYSRDELLDLFELEGLVAGSLSDAAGAKAAFLKLLTLDPAHKLKGRLAPRVTTPFFEAKGQVADRGALALTAQAPVVERFLVTAVVFAVTGDAKGWGTKLVVHVKEAGGWRVVTGAPPTLSAPTKAARVEAWAELRTEKGWVLAVAGSELAPVVAEAPNPPPPPPSAVPVPEPVAVQPAGPAPMVVEAPKPASPPAEPRLRWAAYTLGGLGALGLVGGGLLELNAWQTLDPLERPQRNASGVVTSLTRKEALGAAESARTSAQWAAVSFGVGAGLLVASAVVFVVESPPPVRVALTPAEGGALFTLQGAFP